MGTVLHWLNDMPLAVLMLVVAVGYTVGRLSWRGLSLGPAGGTLGIAILVGALGLDFHAIYGTDTPRFTIGALGFALFLYSVGFEAGPRFFASLAGGRAFRFVIVGTVVNVVAFLLAWLLGRALDLGPGLTAGVLSGSMTSAATYAAALEVVRDQASIASPLALGFAIVYPVGLVGIVLLMQTLPRLRGGDLAASADGEEVTGRTETLRLAAPSQLMRPFEVRHAEVAGRPLRDLDLPRRTGCTILQRQQDEHVGPATAETVLACGDHVLVQGRFEDLERFATVVGPEIYDQDLRNRMPAPRRVVVLDRDAAASSWASSAAPYASTPPPRPTWSTATSSR